MNLPDEEIETSRRAAPSPKECPFAAPLRAWGAQTVRTEWCDLHGIARGHRLATHRFLEDWRKGFGFSSAALEMDLQGEITRPEGEAMQSGWPSYYALPQPETLLLFPLEESTAQVIAEPYDSAGGRIESAPRATLRRITEQAAARGYSLRIGMEFEFYLLRSNGEALLPGRQAYRMRCGPEENAFREDLQKLLGRMGFNIETAILEDGPGQFEITLKPSDPLSVADAAFRVRNLIKEAATHKGLLATFMSKPLTGEAGSGLHIHQQLCDPEGRSLFHSESDPEGMSDLMRSFIGGQLALIRPACAFYLPTVNAYKRIRSRGQGPLTTTWGFDNRTAAIRALGSGRAGLRFENRVPGGEANPYLALAVAIGTGLYGVDRGLTPPSALRGSAYRQTRDFPSLPATLRESLHALEECKELEECLGSELIQRFISLKQGEEDRFERSVTDWERREYLEYL
jgi:glutamine synthetase